MKTKKKKKTKKEKEWEGNEKSRLAKMSENCKKTKSQKKMTEWNRFPPPERKNALAHADKVTS